MEIKIISYLMYKKLSEINFKDKHNFICNLFQITKFTLYRWIEEYDKTIININDNIIFDFESKLITKPIVCFVISYVLSNINVNSKKIKKELNKQFINNCISIKHINCIINTNKHILNKNIFKKKIIN
jgi:hypothetical protein